jgi:23S rRNA (cytosine1962-C5)-methyltransferase
MEQTADGAELSGYALLDAGDGRRLERFGPHLVDRPAPTALDGRQGWDDWRSADVRFDAGRGWSTPLEPWTIAIGGLVLELRPTASGGLGLYPEHVANLDWLAGQVGARSHGREPAVLNLFAHTGLATLVAARAGAAVAHVDAARSAVAWARRNAQLSGLADRPVRWLVDDAAGFVAREARRGRRYDGIVLDPPSFGRAFGRRWRLAEELPELLLACSRVATDDAFVLLTAHTTGLDETVLADELRGAFGPGLGQAAIETVPLQLEAASGARLELGWAARLAR